MSVLVIMSNRFYGCIQNLAETAPSRPRFGSCIFFGLSGVFSLSASAILGGFSGCHRWRDSLFVSSAAMVRK